MDKARERRLRQRLERRNQPTLRSWKGEPQSPNEKKIASEVVKECGWGRLIFAHTFDDPQDLVDTLLEERANDRDIAMYIRDPHVVLSLAPQDLFLDPSHTFRLWMSELRPQRRSTRGFTVRRLRTKSEARAMNTIYARLNMVPADEDFVIENSRSREMTYFVATDNETGKVVGAVSGVDHVEVFGDPENGSSLWSLAVDPQTAPPGVGEALVQQLAEHYAARGRSFMDLSVMHDNTSAIRLYKKLGFKRVPVFSIKRKNRINEPLFVRQPEDEGLNPYAQIIADEARRRGVKVAIRQAEKGYIRLTHAGVSIDCRESLSEMTSAVAMSICDDKAMTRMVVEEAGLRVPAQRVSDCGEGDEDFLAEYGRIVVKPARGEQGHGVHVDIDNVDDMREAVDEAQRHCSTVLVEQFVQGMDLRVVVINFEVVAAAIRQPAQITGTGQHTIKTLIEKQSRRRSAATGGESRIPLDSETYRTVSSNGYSIDDVLPEGEVINVRRSANLHTGGTIHDVTADLSPALAQAAAEAARAIDIPVVGVDFIVPDPSSSDYYLIEANERPGLANHEPQPTAERFIDLLFPATAARHTNAKGRRVSPDTATRD